MSISIEEMAEQFKLLGDKTRLKIVTILNQQDMCVCQLVELLQTTQPNISQHLRKLKDAGLVQEERRGQWIFYSLQVAEQPHLHDALQYLPKLEEEVQQKIYSMLCE
ncbi:metalloregulator ArsR/SmtB family transcription factor [Paenibacillus sp. ACRRX]|uniref:ArsR/SmtB family transcription factor n=1 Tax=Paenibacillus sp. ACRRX TaxID=2918206 RepID=UPI001EF55F05|nr:metalloregulator ArsR/SmtB family transcription factor [Paenibacillus sp. ACRRX]MCG7409395.1 metalloregulator ArsR/SmtB family transcription factor [Paenibacillus sp. ACRRX]